MNHDTARARSGSRKPMAEVIDDAGQEPGFGDAEQEAQHVEARRALHEQHRDRQHAPRDHDARDPEPRADAREDQVARHLEQRVADEEHARAESVDGGAEPEIAVHLQRREADVHAVDPRDDVEQQQERQQAPADLRQREAFAGRAVVGQVARRGDQERPSGGRRAIVGALMRARQPASQCDAGAALGCEYARARDVRVLASVWTRVSQSNAR